MGQEDDIRKKGIVTSIERDRFMVELDDQDHTVEAHLSGSIRQNNIEIEMYDRVTVEISQYDLDKGRIVHREE